MVIAGNRHQPVALLSLRFNELGRRLAVIPFHSLKRPLNKGSTS